MKLYPKVVLGFLLCLGTFSSCHHASSTIEPCVQAPPLAKEVDRERRLCVPAPTAFDTSPFASLSPEEAASDWGKELYIALVFADDFDLYRAITGFKRALILLPPEEKTRELEITYDTALAYYLGKKYLEAIYTVESSPLFCVDTSFPAYFDLLLILYDSYHAMGQEEKALQVLARIESISPSIAADLSLLASLQRGDVEVLVEEANNPSRSYCEGIYDRYCCETKSVRMAETLNLLLPGSGYWYVGQRQTAVTAFLVNALFIGATVYFFENGNVPAGAITASLESGWYLGGMYGAGLAAKMHNERLYECYAGKIATRERLFPLFMLKYTF